MKINTVKPKESNKKKKKRHYNITNITYYNCDKKEHYANKYFNLLEN